MDPPTHKRYLDYRERHGYFGNKLPLLSMTEFASADLEYRTLDAKGDARDDDEQVRFDELSRLLMRD